MPPSDGYFAPSLPKEYPCRAAMAPASRNDNQTADPATSPAAPSSAKIPAPTIAPTPMNDAWTTDVRRVWLSFVATSSLAMPTALLGGQDAGGPVPLPAARPRAKARRLDAPAGHPARMTTATEA